MLATAWSANAWDPAPLLVPGLILIGLGVLLFGGSLLFPRSARPVREPAAAAQPRWTDLIDADGGPVEPAARRRIVEGLALVGAPWCADILAVAYTQETLELREAVIDAIGRCSGDVVPTLERAFMSSRAVERYAAIDAASRRADVALLERGILDRDGTVALAAAYGLVRAGRKDAVETALAERSDAPADDIRRILPVLA